jgi:PAS domain S-box-containing protein
VRAAAKKKQRQAPKQECPRGEAVLRRPEEQLATESGATYREVLDAAPDAVVVVNRRGEIVLLNLQAERQFGYERDELIGRGVQDIIPEGFADRVADGVQTGGELLAQPVGVGVELSARRKDGSAFPIEVTFSPLKSAGGILVTAAIRDLTMRRAAEAKLRRTLEELERSNEELALFACVAGHDLAEPLRMVASYTQLLSKRYTGRLDADADELIAFAADGAIRMQRFIENLLASSRVGRTRGLRDCSSEEALREALMNLRGAIQETGAEVTHDPLPAIVADDTQLLQLFQNLVGNAIKYHNGEAPRVHVSAARDGQGRWVFSVKDNGLGIKSEDLGSIFGKFLRLPERQGASGSGMGLAICQRIVEQHGGTLSVESQPGRGSTFRFALDDK